MTGGMYSSQWVALLGQDGGQTIIGGTQSGDDLVLESNASNDGEIQFGALAYVDEATGAVTCVGLDAGAGAIENSSGGLTVVGDVSKGGGVVKEFYADGTGLDTTIAITITFGASSSWNGHVVEIYLSASDTGQTTRYSSIARYSVQTANTADVPQTTDMTHDLVGVTEAIATGASPITITITLTTVGAIDIDRYGVYAKVTSCDSDGRPTGMTIA